MGFNLHPEYAGNVTGQLLIVMTNDSQESWVKSGCVAK